MISKFIMLILIAILLFSCETTCKDGTHLATNDSCEDNSRLIQCRDASPDNSDVEKKDVTINWKAGKWELPAECTWSCKENYEKKDNLCILLKTCKKVSFNNIVSDGYDSNASVYTDLFDNYKLILEFYESTPVGIYNLDSEKNKNFKTCKQCLLITKDNKKYFPKNGKIEVTQNDAFDGLSKGDIKTINLVEVTIDKDFKSTIVENGDCLDLELSSWDTTNYTPCNNNERKCNNDKIETCKAHVWKVTNDCSLDNATCNDKNECITGNGCTLLSFSNFNIINDFGFVYESSDGDYNLSVSFLESTKKGIYNLANEKNKNYSTCEQCILIKNKDKRYYPISGTLEVISGDGQTEKSKVKIKDLKLVEVTIDGTVSTPIEDGSCVDTKLIEWDSM